MNNFEGKINYAYNNSELANYFNLYSDIGKYWKKHLKDSIYEIKYENLIEDKENEIKNLIKACNLPWDRHCLNFYENKNPILTLSSKQARQKIYKTSVNKYKFYEPYLSKYFNSLNLK